jgi:hypothetical protein
VSVLRVLPALGLSLLCVACAAEPVAFVAPPHDAAESTTDVIIVPGGQFATASGVRTGVWVLREDGSLRFCSMRFDLGAHHRDGITCTPPVSP